MNDDGESNDLYICWYIVSLIKDNKHPEHCLVMIMIRKSDMLIIETVHYNHGLPAKNIVCR